jgi:hypothetical protein
MDSASLCSLAGWYNNPIPTRFLAPIDCSKIQTLRKELLNFPTFAGSLIISSYSQSECRVHVHGGDSNSYPSDLEVRRSDHLLASRVSNSMRLGRLLYTMLHKRFHSYLRDVYCSRTRQLVINILFIC